MDMLFHITTATDYARAQEQGQEQGQGQGQGQEQGQGYYLPLPYAVDGFVHCSFARQVAPVANRFYRESDDLIVLMIEPQKLSARVVCENLEGGQELFPHVYGPIPLESVVMVLALHRTVEGAWAFDPP